MSSTPWKSPSRSSPLFAATCIARRVYCTPSLVQYILHGTQLIAEDPDYKQMQVQMTLVPSQRPLDRQHLGSLDAWFSKGAV